MSRIKYTFVYVDNQIYFCISNCYNQINKSQNENEVSGMDDKYLYIAERLKAFRKIRNMKQEELSEKSGLNIANIRSYESGVRYAKPESLKLIADALDVSVNDLINIEYDTTYDIVSILSQMKENTCMDITGETDENGEYIPSSIQISFKDDNINKKIIEQFMANKKSPQSSYGPGAIQVEFRDGVRTIDTDFTFYSTPSDKVKRPEE